MAHGGSYPQEQRQRQQHQQAQEQAEARALALPAVGVSGGVHSAARTGKLSDYLAPPLPQAAAPLFRLLPPEPAEQPSHHALVGGLGAGGTMMGDPHHPHYLPMPLPR